MDKTRLIELDVGHVSIDYRVIVTTLCIVKSMSFALNNAMIDNLNPKSWQADDVACASCILAPFLTEVKHQAWGDPYANIRLDYSKEFHRKCLKLKKKSGVSLFLCLLYLMFCCCCFFSPAFRLFVCVCLYVFFYRRQDQKPFEDGEIS